MANLIEFMGLPGSGKSTLARSLLDGLRQHGFFFLESAEAETRCIRRRQDGIMRNFLKKLPFWIWEPFSGSRNALVELQEFSSQHTALFALVFEVLNRRPIPLQWRQCLIFTFFKRCVQRQLIETYLHPDEGVIVEEGLAQGVFTLLNCLPPEYDCEREVSLYISHIPLPSAIFWVDSEPMETMERLWRRPLLPVLWEGFSDAELIERIESGRRHLGLAFLEFKKRGVPVCRINNPSGKLDEASGVIRSQGLEWARGLTKQ